MASCSAPENPNAPKTDVETTSSSIHDPNAALCQDPVDMVNPVLVTGNGVETIPGCCGGTRLDQLHNSLDVYSNSASESFVRSLRPKMQLFAPHGTPFSQSEVYISTGWVRGPRHACPAPYQSSLCTDGHGAIDYIKTASGDPSFQVRAVAAGQVISIERNEDEGNTVVIEHTAPDGTRYRSIYVHLRNGARHDCLAAKADAADDSDGYRKYMDKQICPDPAHGIAGNLDPLYWGTEAQTLHVGLGDIVQARQFIADGGNTGRGAIGRSIDGNGNIGGTNVHLHLYFAVFHPGIGQAGTNAQWIVVDPYGVYGYVSGNCYDAAANTPGYRLFAPFNLFTRRNVDVALGGRSGGPAPGSKRVTIIRQHRTCRDDAARLASAAGGPTGAARGHTRDAGDLARDGPRRCRRSVRDARAFGQTHGRTPARVAPHRRRDAVRQRQPELGDTQSRRQARRHDADGFLRFACWAPRHRRAASRQGPEGSEEDQCRAGQHGSDRFRVRRAVVVEAEQP